MKSSIGTGSLRLALPGITDAPIPLAAIAQEIRWGAVKTGSAEAAFSASAS